MQQHKLEQYLVRNTNKLEYIFNSIILEKVLYQKAKEQNVW